MTPSRRHSANPIVDLWLRLRYSIARGLRRAADLISPDSI